MPTPTRRRTSLYCLVVSTGPLVIVRMPEGFVAWRTVRPAVNEMMRREHGVLAKNIHSIEGLAGDPEGDGDHGESLDVAGRAFAGDLMTMRRFHLHAWDDATGTFVNIRAGAPREEGQKIPSYPLAHRIRDGWYSDGDYEARGGRMVWMSPEDYLSNVRPLVMDECSRDNVDDLKAHISQSRPLDPLKIYTDGREDGRHRAHAAKELGILSVPVIVWRTTDA
jgi:hypothetical protein